MKQILLTLLFVIPFYSFSQSCLGLELPEIIKIDPTLSYDVKVQDNGTTTVAVSNGSNLWVHTLGVDGKCIASSFTPKDQLHGVNDRVQYYNDNAIIISSTKWKMYVAGKTLVIELFYSENSKAYTFIIYYEGTFNDE